jgi:opacity protein-like surface antigen
MKSTLLGGAACLLSTVCALGADMGVPIAIPPAVPPPHFIWTGCYAGGQAGGGFGQKDLNDSVGIVSSISGFTSANLNISGYMLGGQIGCDYQFSPSWVVGIEGAATGGNIHV